jgi:hypothetical protein
VYDYHWAAEYVRVFSRTLRRFEELSFSSLARSAALRAMTYFLAGMLAS